MFGCSQPSLSYVSTRGARLCRVYVTRKSINPIPCIAVNRELTSTICSHPPRLLATYEGISRAVPAAPRRRLHRRRPSKGIPLRQAEQGRKRQATSNRPESNNLRGRDSREGDHYPRKSRFLWEKKETFSDSRFRARRQDETIVNCARSRAQYYRLTLMFL